MEEFEQGHGASFSKESIKFFLKSSKREPLSLYQISSDNPEKDKIHKAFF
jgi:hypothetical protein